MHCLSDFHPDVLIQLHTISYCMKLKVSANSFCIQEMWPWLPNLLIKAWLGGQVMWPCLLNLLIKAWLGGQVMYITLWVYVH